MYTNIEEDKRSIINPKENSRNLDVEESLTSSMMRNTSLLKWTHNNNKNNGSTKNGSNTWIHAPEALQRGHVAYLVKFLGNTEVEQPKGLEVVKEGIRKLKFSQQLRKAEGSKTPKVELTISIDGVAVQEPKSKRILHQYPLHRISYCADDKAEKKFFSFIAKEADTEKHMCFVFVSDKLAEEITLTIGQAFDLAYRRFLDTSGRELEMKKQLMILQKRVAMLEEENGGLRKRLQDVSRLKERSDIDDYMRLHKVTDISIFQQNGSMNGMSSSSNSEDSASGKGSLNGDLMSPPPIPPRASEIRNKSFGEELISLSPSPTVGTKLEGLLFEDFEELGLSLRTRPHNYTNGDGVPRLSPPPKPPRETQRTLSGALSSEKDLFGADPFNPRGVGNNSSGGADPFGMSNFNARNPQELENAIGALDKRLLEMKAGFSIGISFENDDFPLESLDPLRN